ncbi:Growth-regulating factor 12 [Hibiscus syriacus]|uniref:Growth-regulating factor n=1 Tax=Hibiscus syriacus TaxID=106335 RepID=A0A6A3BXF0_HIBSY|nr:Growth-regulating factor 12 [Hibiscus syriacus]
MHRGCRRSRKPVETTSQTALPDSTLSEISIKLSKNLETLSAPVCSRYVNQSSCNTSTGHETPAIAAIGSDIVCGNQNSISGNASTSTITAMKKDGENDSKRIKNEKFLELKISPCDIFQYWATAAPLSKNEIEVELGRCRRTDGKRWRCSRDVIPDQKYCARHMHRGARKHAEVSQPVSVPTNGHSRHSGLTIANKAICPALSTSLSISIPSPPLVTLDEKNTSSSSETTISDTTVSVFDNGNFS